MNKLRSYFFKPEDWHDLAWSRILFYFLLIINLGGFTSFKYYLNFPDIIFNPTGFLQTIYLKNLVKEYIELIYIVFYLSVFFSMIGLMTKFSTWVSFFAGLIIFSIPRSYSGILFLFIPLLFILFIFALSQCGDHFSLDSLIFKKNKKPIKSFEYNWPIKAAKFVFIFFFFSSGFHKLKAGGLEWFLSDNLVNNFLCSPFTRIDSVPLFVSDLKLNYYAANYKNLFRFAACMVIVFQLLSPLMLLKKFKNLFLTVFISMHVFSIFTLFISPLVNIPLYAFWINWKWLQEGLYKKWALRD